ncbi:MAG: response regulator transcription factor [Verrucomicrobiota bacterium JB023]|nr:response regulator transcription factor [Verrucomicrobiota bacterium JB023]
MQKPLSILIIEDNQQYTGSLKRMIQLTDRMELIASYHDAEQFQREVDEPIKRGTDVILLDLNLPGKNGMQLIPYICKEFSKCHILVLTQKSDHQVTLEAIRLGASGYLLKKSSISTIRDAILEVHDGGCIIDPKLSKAILGVLTEPNRPHEKQILTMRERQVLEFLALGHVKKEVAVLMGVSYSAVAQYTESIYKKLQVSNIAAAVATAMRKGLIR